MTQYQGQWRKMNVELSDVVQYSMRFSQECVGINDWIGHTVRLKHNGEILCINCGRKTKKSFNQGYCFPCMRSLAECDMCIVKPEKCHFDQGTCRDEIFAQSQCFQPHIIYFSNTSGLKVGITRTHQIPTRWIDQGAIAAIEIARVQSRIQSGLVETQLAQTMSDKTDWRKMLKNDVIKIDLAQKRAEAKNELELIRQKFAAKFGDGWLSASEECGETNIEYPVLAYPEKVKSYNLDKEPIIEDRLLGIKGQYLIFENAVINVRKYSGYVMQAEKIS